jgi:hypothetical protein
MSGNSTSNNPNSGTRSSSKRQRAPKTEDELLNQQATIAKAAIVNTTVEMAENLQRTFDVRAWTLQYPLKTTGAAAVAGFILGERLMTSFKEKKEDETPTEEIPEQKPSPSNTEPTTWSNLSSLLLTTATDILKDLAHTWFVENINQKQASAQQETTLQTEQDTSNPEPL